MRQYQAALFLFFLTSVHYGKLQTQVPDSQLMADIVVAIDSSSAMSTAAFTEVKQFLYALLTEQFTIAQSNVRIALFSVGGIDSFPHASAFLNSITSTNTLKTYIDNLPYDGSTGQLLTSVLSDASDQNFQSEDYRNSIRNHLFLYITATSTFSDGNAAVLAIALRQAGIYGFLVIRYKSNADSTSLLSIAGGADCYFEAGDINGLNAIKTRIQQKTNDAYYTTNGTYCP